MSAASYGGLLDAVRGVHWQARRTSGNAAAGTHQSKQRGTSAEFTEYRLYRQGEEDGVEFPVEGGRIDILAVDRTDRPVVATAPARP